MTELQENRIIEVLDAHKSLDAYKILAKEFGISQTIIRKHCTQMRADCRLRDKSNDKWSPAEIKTIKEMVDAGHPIIEIAAFLRKCDSSIRKKIKELYDEIPVIKIDGEVWRRVEDTQYEVSDNGRFRRIGQRRLTNGSVHDGYIYVNLITNEGKKLRSIHRLVAQAFVPNPEGKELVDHIDGNRTNNNANNLRWVTAEENANNQHRLEELSRVAEKNRVNKKIDDSLKTIFDTGISKLDLIQRILNYKEDSQKE